MVFANHVTGLQKLPAKFLYRMNDCCERRYKNEEQKIVIRCLCYPYLCIVINF